MHSKSLVATAAVLDVVLTLAFVVIGRSSHAEGITLAGTMTTWWPFLAGLAVGWIGTAAWLRPMSIVRSGIGIWLITVGIGMALRVVSGQGTAVSFIVVALVAVGVLLLGWRAAAIPILRRSRRKTPRGV
ncbi:DUF3054 domain-containing protein [Spelaeicoccus albus]|uniref:DUF3054 family protein n=1 Tax=Spelaeicoccus albus TaxID=1280376 RepID=A0A7Z0D3X3_9MICO|nr:DUF3054 domain-containing protein [Spelaeicoccus albus]NYI68417.1 hypothetical protein [Spelaeicoccus albus]